MSCTHQDRKFVIGFILCKFTVFIGGGALMICTNQDRESAIGLILGKFTVFTEGVGTGGRGTDALCPPSPGVCNRSYLG